MKALSTSEEQVMAALWACGKPATRRQIAAKLPPDCVWADSTPVSYTHLDVYKRQPQGGGACLQIQWQYHPGRCWRSQRRPAGTPADVYKRQA